MNLKIAIGIPAFNEEKNIGRIISALEEFDYEIIVCDDGSLDQTGNIAEKMGAIVVKHEKNKGYGAAIRSIFTKAKTIDSDILITFDGDGQHNVSEIKDVLEPLISKKADIVIGSRFLGEGENKIPKYRKIGIKAITKVSSLSQNLNIKDTQSGFRGYNRKALDEINVTENGMGISTEILMKASKKDLKIIEVPIIINYEGETSTHNPASHGISVIISTMKFTALDHPLKFYGIPGTIFLIIGLFFIVWTLHEFSLHRVIITNIALIAAGTTIIGIIFLLTSIILYSMVSLIREQK
ncbi:glycosyltransferase family 2 protein [Candidatus Nitrosopumilus sp. SW]|nr:glycosyltransferase family 2 protein [Candidatus Nitrosopumilus sp. SW]